MQLQDKVVVITGASSGIGALTAQMLSELGAIPVLTARSEDRLISIGESLKGPHCIQSMDVSDDNSVEQAFQAIMSKYGRIDILLNNAGYGQFMSFMDMPSQQFVDMMNVNYMGIVRCTKAVLPYMIQSKRGQIVNVASIAGKIGTSKSTAYSASKHAVVGFSSALRQEMKPYGIQVSTVNPGPIDTPFFDLADPSGDYVNNIRWMIMKPEKVVRTIVSVMKTGRAEVDLPWMASFGTKLYQLFPNLADKLTYRLLNKK